MATDREVRDAEGKSFVQVLNLRPGMGQAGEGHLRALSCFRQPVGNFPRVQPPRELGAPAASGCFLWPPARPCRQRLRLCSPTPSGFRIRTELEQ